MSSAEGEAIARYPILKEKKVVYSLQSASPWQLGFSILSFIHSRWVISRLSEHKLLRLVFPRKLVSVFLGLRYLTFIHSLLRA